MVAWPEFGNESSALEQRSRFALPEFLVHSAPED
jgi:hypothetical protein